MAHDKADDKRIPPRIDGDDGNHEATGTPPVAASPPAHADGHADGYADSSPVATDSNDEAKPTQRELARQQQQQALLNQKRQRLAAQQEIRAKAGRALIAARTEQKYNLEYVSDTLRIPQRYLQKIEAGEIDGLPGVAYYIGFMRSYAKLLGLDSDALVKEVSESFSEGDRNPEYHFVDSENEEKNRLGFYIMMGAGALLIIYIIWYLVASSAVRFPSLLSVRTGDEAGSETVVVDTPPALIDEGRTTPSTAVARPTTPEILSNESSDEATGGLQSESSSDSSQSSFGSALDPVFDATTDN